MISASCCCRQRWLQLNYCVQFTRALFVCTMLRNSRWQDLRYVNEHTHQTPSHLTSIQLHARTNTHSSDAANLVIRTTSPFETIRLTFCSLYKLCASLRDMQIEMNSEITRGWVMWGTWRHQEKKNDTWGRNVRNGGEKEQNHLVKHFSVKSSSDLSTQFSVCFSSDNWTVVSVYTEPQGDRKHILAGLDRKKRTTAVRRQSQGDFRRAAVRTCVNGC